MAPIRGRGTSDPKGFVVLDGDDGDPLGAGGASPFDANGDYSASLLESEGGASSPGQRTQLSSLVALELVDRRAATRVLPLAPSQL